MEIKQSILIPKSHSSASHPIRDKDTALQTNQQYQTDEKYTRIEYLSAHIKRLRAVFSLLSHLLFLLHEHQQNINIAKGISKRE